MFLVNDYRILANLSWWAITNEIRNWLFRNLVFLLSGLTRNGCDLLLKKEYLHCSPS